MDLTSTCRVATPAGTAWERLIALEDHYQPAPGCRTQRRGPATWYGSIEFGARPVSIGFTGKAELVEREDSQRRAILSVEGAPTRYGTLRTMRISVQLAEDTEAHCRLVAHVSDSRGGNLGRQVFSQLVDQAVHSLAARLEAPVSPFFVGCRVHIDDTPTETGTIVEDFGTLAGAEVVIDAEQTVRARRWAIELDSGHLRFADDEELAPIDT